MLAMAARGEAHEDDWLVAERQTAGRGRQGRVWISPPGNLYASGLVKLRANDPPTAPLALVAGLALHLALDLQGARLKWPNDLMFGDAKIAGILLERQENFVVVGVGVNLVHAPAVPGRVATSLIAQGISISPTEAADRLAESFGGWRRKWRSSGIGAITPWWLDRAHPTGTLLSAALPDGTRVDGSFGGLTEEGALILRLADGTTRVIHAGDVFLV